MSSLGNTGGLVTICADGEELLSVMENQEELCGELLEIARRERVAVANDLLEELELLTRQKSQIIDDMEQLEGRRRNLASRMLGQRGLPGDTPMIGLADALSEPYSRRLRETRDRIATLVADLREANDDNMRLMGASLSLVRDSLRQLRRAMGDGDSYTSEGRPVAGTARGSIAIDFRA